MKSGWLIHLIWFSRAKLWRTLKLLKYSVEEALARIGCRRKTWLSNKAWNFRQPKSGKSCQAKVWWKTFRHKRDWNSGNERRWKRKSSKRSWKSFKAKKPDQAYSRVSSMPELCWPNRLQITVFKLGITIRGAQQTSSLSRWGTVKMAQLWNLSLIEMVKNSKFYRSLLTFANSWMPSSIATPRNWFTRI